MRELAADKQPIASPIALFCKNSLCPDTAASGNHAELTDIIPCIYSVSDPLQSMLSVLS